MPDDIQETVEGEPNFKERQPKIFQMGFNKCSTRTFNNFFEINGVKSVHHAGGALAKSIEKNMAAGLDLIGDFPEYTAFTDMEFVSDTGYIAAQRWFQTFHKWHPDAYFILNTRNIKDWISSRLRHGDGNFLRRFEELYGLSQD
ncbi:sulfotransferase [Ruegeria meonggei]|uniref:sulfotransferase n=1 Tax=Ruegeria meonggei TaxID=1446476 RepID=UPI00366E00F1